MGTQDLSLKGYTYGDIKSHLASITHNIHEYTTFMKGRVSQEEAVESQDDDKPIICIYALKYKIFFVS